MITDKKLNKIEKILAPDQIAEFSAMSADLLTSRITASELAIKKAVDELESNPKYQDLKESLKDVSAGLRDVKKHQRAIIDYCTHLIEDKE